MNYKDYQKIICEDVTQILSDMGCQPILFIGSGLAKRYCNAPNWSELLQYLSEACPADTKGINYHRQVHSDFTEIGSALTKIYTEWAWGDGKKYFPADFFTSDDSTIYIKYKISQRLIELCNNFNMNSSNFSKEIKKLQNIRPHAVITTNYDQMIESIFPDYSPVIGQKIIRANFVSFGEIYKIHGCCTDPKSIVFTKEDYVNFMNSKKYLSAKLLTYFAEHPLLFIGYSATDKNMAGILSDIDEILSQGDNVIPNIYLLEWKEECGDKFEKIEAIIPTENNKQVRVKSIVANDFSWVFDAFNSGDIATPVDPKMLRKLMANTYRLIRHDFPRRNMQVDYQHLEAACNSTDGLAKLYGISVLDTPESIAAQYPYVISQLAHKLGYEHWSKADKLMKQIEEMNNIKFKESDNPYHINVRTGVKSATRKYSAKMLELLRLAKDGQGYTLEPFNN